MWHSIFKIEGKLAGKDIPSGGLCLTPNRGKIMRKDTIAKRASYYVCSMALIMGCSSLVHGAARSPYDRNIAVLAYGSVVNDPRELQTESDFQLAQGLHLPTRLSRHSSKGKPTEKLSVTIDPNTSGGRVYYATSSISRLPQARENLAHREGATGRDIKANMAYVRDLRGKGLDDNETFGAYKGWAGVTKQMPAASAQKIVDWAIANGYDAVIWASLPVNIETQLGGTGAQEAVGALLEGNQQLLRNTRAYLSGFPEDLKSAQMKRIIGGGTR